MVDVKGTRKYSSAVRDEQAARTRARILDAASELFLERGYARTTMKDIADLAGVARDTVHAVFGSKARVLTALIDLRLVPDGSVASVTQRPDAQADQGRGRPTQADRAVRRASSPASRPSCDRSSRSCARRQRSSPRWRRSSRRWIASA